ncbi:MAG: alpha/beta hydrolase [Pseudomonadota bacterium]
MLEQVRALLEELKGQGLPKLSDMPPQMGREAFNALVKMLDAPAIALPRTEDIALASPAGPIPARLVDPAPQEGEATHLMLYFHGGGFVLGNIETHHPMVSKLSAATGLPILSIDYRLAPEHPFPAALEDCLAATRWAAAQGAALLGRPVKGLVVAGDSAGANLAAVVAQETRGEPAVRLALQVLLYPVTDMLGDYPSRRAYGHGHLLEAEDMAFFANAYMPDPALAEDTRLSPIKAEDLSGLPPALVVTAEYDPLHDEGVAYARALAAAGLEVRQRDEAGLIHGFYNLRGAMPEADKRLLALAHDITAMLKG